MGRGDPKALPWGLGHTSSHKLEYVYSWASSELPAALQSATHRPPDPQVAALAVRPAQVLTSSPSYKEPGHHTLLSWTPQTGTFEGWKLSERCPMYWPQGQEPRRLLLLRGAGIRDLLHRLSGAHGLKTFFGWQREPGICAHLPDPESKNRGGEAGRERDAYKARNIAAARGVRGEGGTDQLLLMGGILHGGVDVQGSRLELGVLLG